jgi:hypothetical protein
MHPDQVAHEVAGWLERRLPAGWFTGPPEVTVDGEEILVVGALPDADGDPLPRAERFREETREQRMRLAAELQRRWRRKVSWGVDCDGERLLFTTLSIPVMTRLRLAERRVLDTLIDDGQEGPRPGPEPLRDAQPAPRRSSHDSSVLTATPVEPLTR